MDTIAQGFRRLAETFRRIADSQTSREAQYDDACAQAFGLFERLKAEARIPHIDLSGWEKSPGGNREGYVYDPKQIQAAKFAWELQTIKLCGKLPATCGLTRNPLTLDPPEDHGIVTLRDGIEFRDIAFNFETVCNWLAENVIEDHRLEAIQEKPKPAAAQSPEGNNIDQTSLDARALALFLENNGLSKKKIADKLGIRPQGLNRERCPKLAAAIAAHKASKDPTRRTVHGKKSNGHLEAWEDE